MRAGLMVLLFLGLACASAESGFGIGRDEPEQSRDLGVFEAGQPTDTQPVDIVDEPDSSAVERDSGRRTECEIGERRACGNRFGVCFPSEQECVNGRWDTCPGTLRQRPETCDGLDNDCDDTTDEELGLGEPCEVGLGLCRRAGLQICGPDEQITCSAVPGDQQVEVCDDLDNDCDGQTDEHTERGTPCTAGLGECRTEGYFDCSPELGMYCTAVPGAAQDELCGDQQDNDCDGLTDEGFPVGELCTLVLDHCRYENLGRFACSEDLRELECRFSPADVAAAPASELPCAPVLPRAHLCGRQLDLTWLPVPGAEQYRIIVDVPDAPEGGSRNFFYTTHPFYSLTGLPEGVRHVIQVATQIGDSSTVHPMPLEVTPGTTLGQVVDDAEELIIPAGAVFTLDGTREYTRRIVVHGTLCVTPAPKQNPGDRGTLELVAPQIEIHGTLLASGRGHPGGEDGGDVGLRANGGGGAHGGDGGTGGQCRASGGLSYQVDAGRPIARGSGGGGWTNGSGPGGGAAPREQGCNFGAGPGGAGGGALHLVASEQILLRGWILAHGTNGSPGAGRTQQVGLPAGGGGGGGGVLLDAPEVLLLGRITLDGGEGGGGGGGGRLVVRGLTLDQAHISLRGGRGSAGGTEGTAGTIDMD